MIARDSQPCVAALVFDAHVVIFGVRTEAFDQRAGGIVPDGREVVSAAQDELIENTVWPSRAAAVDFKRQRAR